jgi:hypothetical protein
MRVAPVASAAANAVAPSSPIPFPDTNDGGFHRLGSELRDLAQRLPFTPKLVRYITLSDSAASAAASAAAPAVRTLGQSGGPSADELQQIAHESNGKWVGIAGQRVSSP